jgi:asparagine synthase (glutamine-hydrolysing)
MCGLVGVASGGAVDGSCVERMRDRLVHRGPDHGGIWRSEDGRVCMGLRRLKILDLSEDANQPFVSSDGRYVIVFNGEIYNHASLRRELVAAGAHFRTRSDTEVLVEAFARWGEHCLDRLVGMFAFAVWDRIDRRLFCARDRVGEKPFYYMLINDSFVFGSELKALLPWPGFRLELDYPALIDFLTFGFVPDPKSIWRDCKKLAPGHHMSVELGEAGPPRVGSPVRYWDMEFQPDRSVDDWGEAIRDTLESAAAEMAFADVPVGTFLSGGVDSSSVTAALSRRERSVRTFTIGFGERDYDERPFARAVAALYGTEHSERLVRPDDVRAVADRLYWHYDEPFNDYSYLPTYYVCREARRLVTVALTGDGGDEAFAGYRKYQRLALHEAVQPFVPRFAGRLMVRAADALFPARSRGYALLRQYGQDAMGTLAEALITGLPRRPLERAARGPLRAALADYSPEETVTELLAQAPPSEVGLVNSMRYLDFKLTLAGDILVKVDRASMATSLEARPVFLHPEVLSLAARIPPERLASPRQAKRALKAAVRPWLPDSLLDRPKAGFAMPLGTWLRTELTDLARRDDGPDPLDELIDPGFVERTARDHAHGRTDATPYLHSLLFLREWMRRWL